MILVGRHVRVSLESAGIEEEEDGCTIRRRGVEGGGYGDGDSDGDDGVKGEGMLAVAKRD